MGALAFWGGLQGLAQGIGQASNQAEMERQQRERENALLQREMARQEAITGRNDDTLAIRQQLAELRATQAAGGGGGKRSDLEVLAGLTPEQVANLRMRGGMAQGEASDLAMMEAGKTPMQEMAVSPDRFTNPDRQDESASGTLRTEKYAPGQGAALAARGYQALRRAVGLASPSAEDNQAKADQTRYVTDAAQRFEKGDKAAAGGALVAQGKAEFGESGTSHLTGKPAQGSVAQSQVNENNAQAKKYAADAGQGGAGGGGNRVHGTFVDQVGNRWQVMKDGPPVLLGKDRAYSSMVNAERAALLKLPANIGKSPDEIERMAVERVMARANSGQNPAGGDGQPSGQKPALDMKAAEQVRAEFRAGRLTREQAKAKLQQLGFN